MANKRGLLTSAEIDIIQEGVAYAEAIWAWLMSYCSDLYQCGFIPWEVHAQLISEVVRGRGAAGLIGAQLNCQLPLSYVHAVHFLIKFTNVIVVLQTSESLCTRMNWEEDMVHTPGSPNERFFGENGKYIPTDGERAYWIILGL